MNDIKIAVNLYVFALAVIIWVILGALTAIPNYAMPQPLSFLFATLTGVILTIVQGFKEGVTFNSTTETTSTSITKTATPPQTEKEIVDEKAIIPPADTAGM